MRAPLCSSSNDLATRHRGVTLLDLVVAILLLSIVSSLTVPRMTEAIARHRIESTAHQLAGHLLFLRNRAIVEGRELSVVISTEPLTLACDQLEMPGQPGKTFAINLSEGANITQVTTQGITGTGLRIDRFGDVYDSIGRIDACKIELANSKAIATLAVLMGNVSVEARRK